MTEIGFTPKEFLTKNKMAEVLDKFKFQTEDDLFAAGMRRSAQVVQSFNRKERREQELERQRQEAEELLNQPAKKNQKNESSS